MQATINVVHCMAILTFLIIITIVCNNYRISSEYDVPDGFFRHCNQYITAC